MLFDQIQLDLVAALKSGDKLRVDTLRFLIAAVKKFDMDTYLPGSALNLSEEDVLKIVRRQVKTHDESILAFTKGARPDLADREKAELVILKTYLPAEMADEGITRIVREIIASGNTNFGAIMGIAMKRLAGQAGGDRVARIAKQELNG